ncbi:MAG: hypothetical protein D4R97_01765 [Bacteroidetes bacterium]|nr:MAG: hypothetical protein D4R97_01765 [Bacteroidota bacterium]
MDTPYPSSFARFYDLIYAKLRPDVDTSHSDLVTQVNHLSMRFEWNEGENTFSETWNSELRFFFRYELEYLLTQSKFKSFSIFGDYKGNPLSCESRDFVVVCRK